jgi:hypothetical protein
MIIEAGDPITGLPDWTEGSPARKEYEFHLSPPSKKAEALLEKIGDPSVSDPEREVLRGPFRLLPVLST